MIQAKIRVQSHVGYFLIDDGLPQLEGDVGCRLSIAEFLRRAIQRRATGAYLGTLALLTVLLVGLLVLSVLVNRCGRNCRQYLRRCWH